MSKNKITVARRREIQSVSKSRYRARQENARETEQKIEKFWVASESLSLCVSFSSQSVEKLR